ncbi:oligosaccharide flippase family protein, partial [Bacillus mycoides]
VFYTYAYRPYSIMLSIATMGLPLAFSKMVSKYDQLNDYHTVKRELKSGIVFMVIMGVISCLALYMLSPDLAKLVIDGNDQSGYSVVAVTHNIQIVSFALILVPVMSLIRGFFQG